ncbi:hypothetical protein HQ576_16335 [bacterium]|nr:hypothetical protein [bacterium]
MKTRPMAAAIALACLALVAQRARADEDTKPAPRPPTPSRIKLYGNVAAERDKDGKVTKLTLTSVNRVEYRVALDEIGLKLAAEMDGKRAQVLGTYVVEEGARSLTVQSYGVVQKEDPKKVRDKKPVPKRRVIKTTRPTVRKKTTTKKK